MEVLWKSSWRLWNLLFQLLEYCFVNLIKKRTGQFPSLLVLFYNLIHKTPLLQSRGFQCCNVEGVIQTNPDVAVCVRTLYRASLRFDMSNMFVCQGLCVRSALPLPLPTFKDSLFSHCFRSVSRPLYVLCWPLGSPSSEF